MVFLWLMISASTSTSWQSHAFSPIGEWHFYLKFLPCLNSLLWPKRKFYIWLWDASHREPFVLNWSSPLTFYPCSMCLELQPYPCLAGSHSFNRQLEFLLRTRLLASSFSESKPIYLLSPLSYPTPLFIQKGYMHIFFNSWWLDSKDNFWKQISHH